MITPSHCSEPVRIANMIRPSHHCVVRNANTASPIIYIYVMLCIRQGSVLRDIVLEERKTNDTQYRRGLGLNKPQAGVGGKPTMPSESRQPKPSDARQQRQAERVSRGKQSAPVRASGNSPKKDVRQAKHGSKGEWELAQKGCPTNGACQ
ncbi:MAG: hypothetical protein CL932_07515 [Deltaproteobacteria bacterium]|nr:hypothetical protein [Deltaproteobacteria bacterium]